MYQKYVKRSLDVIFASILALIILLPLIFIAIWIKLDSKGPIFFKQKRAGKSLEPFMIYKFRTMTTDAPKDCPTEHLKNAGNFITRSGRVMRKLSIDELPQLINVLIGNMSIVGPRPGLLVQEDLIFERAKYGANDFNPGITGWAQVNGRDEVSIEEKGKLDGEYVENFGFIMDSKCIVKTLSAVLSSKGHKEGHEKERG